MEDEALSELTSLRARVYGRSGADPDDVERLVELEGGTSSRETPQSPEAEAAESAPPVTAPPPAVQPAAAAPRGHERRVILIATVSVVAVGCFVAGLLAGGLRGSEERATAGAQEPSGPLAVEFPEGLTPSYLRVATRWTWDSESLRLGGTVDGAAIWVGTFGDLSEVCLVFDETTSATILCNPTGEYPSGFEWVKATGPAQGTYRFSLEQTGDLEWTFEPAP